MKALIFSMTCGDGHNNMARSLAEQFDKLGVENKIVQTYGFNEKRVARENKQFLFVSKHFPHLYDFIWNKLRKKNHFTNKLPGYVKPCLEYFKENISSFQPDIIITTHYYASSVLSYMKKENLLDKKIITGAILQDFCLAPYWEHSSDVDYIFQAYSNTTEALLEKGFKENQIVTFGLPIKDEYGREMVESKVMRKKLALPEKFTLLIVGGGNGISSAFEPLKSVLMENLDISIICINGRNEKSFKQIQKYIDKNKISNVTNLGFVTNMVEYLQACDLTITRCGSSVISETLAMQKPFIAREKLILNELFNKNFLIENGCGLGLDKSSDAGKKVRRVLENPTLYQTMKDNISHYARPAAARDIVAFMTQKAKEKTQ